MGPFALIAYRATSYLRDTFHALEDPGVPIELKYRASTGDVVTLRADRYIVEIKNGYARVEHPQIIDSEGQIVASLEYAEARHVNFRSLSDQVIHVRASGLAAQVTRLPSGKLDIVDFLPEKKGPPSTIPFDVVLTRAKAVFIDEMSAKPWRQAVSADEVRVTGLGDDWIASTTVSLKGIGTFPLELEKVTGFGIQGKTTTRGAELAPVWAHLSQTAPFAGTDYAKARADSIRVDGPIRVFIPEATADSPLAPVAETRLTVRTRGVRYGQYALDSASFTGLITKDGASGKAQATLGSNRLLFGGSAVWKKQIQASGEARVESPNPSTLPVWIKKQIPSTVDYRDGTFQGWVAYKSPTDYRASGRLRAASVKAQGEELTEVDAEVQYAPGRLSANVRQAIFDGKLTNAAFSLDTRNKGLSGVVRAKAFDLSILAKRFGVKGLTGRGDVFASLGGTVEKPAIDLSSQGSAAFAQDGRRLKATFDISGSYANNSVNLSRALVRGAFGLISAHGSIGQKGALGIKVIGRDLNPSVIDSKVKGQANLIANVTGTAAKPSVRGYVEAYNLSAKNYLIPAVSASFLADRTSLRVTELRATHGTAELTGDAAYAFKNGGISGNLALKGLELADLVGEGVAGLIDIPDLVVGGTVKRPVVTASLSGRNVVAQDLKIDALNARITSDGRIAKVEDASAEVAGGSVSASARYDIDKHEGSAQINAKGVSLADVTPKISTAVVTTGQVGGVAQVNFTDDGVSSVEASGRLRSIGLNGTEMGNGPWSLTYNGHVFGGSLQVGVLERYISAEKLTYDPASKDVGGELNVYNSDVQDLVAIGSRYVGEISPSVSADLHTAKGNVSVGATLSGTIDALKLSVSTLEAKALEYQGVSFGRLVTKGTLEGDVIHVPALELSDGAVAVKLLQPATVNTKGSLDVSLDVQVPLLASLTPIVPQLANNGGSLKAWVDATGKSEAPDLHFSLSARRLFTRIPPVNESPDQEKARLLADADALSFDLTAETSAADKSLSINGNYFYEGFQGQISAEAPFDYKKGIPEDGKVTASIGVAERSLSEIAKYLPAIDGKLSTGTLGGKIEASGSPNNLVLSGGLHLKAESLALVIPKPRAANATGPMPAPNTVDDKFKNVDLSLDLAGDKVNVHAGAESYRGGSFAADVSTPIGEIRRLVSTLKDAGMQSLTDNPVTGSVKLNKLALRQSFPTPSNPADALWGLMGGYLGGTADGEITIGGTVSAPSIEGRLAMSNVDSEIPTIVGTTGEPKAPVVNPTFDLRVNLSEPAKIKTTAASLSVLGGGRLTGSLESPSMRSNLQVENGAITLPAATVRIEQGGTVAFVYEPAPDGAIARLDVDMEGRTAVTAQKYGDVYERYEITLGVKGDLLKEGGLNLTAQSDPPDLTQDRILALLGQVDLISTVATSGFGQSDTERRLRDALTGFALPALTSNLTNKLAQSIGFEYLTIEYNGYEQASFAFGKALGAGFSIQGRRQVGEPTPGIKPLYDIRLVYRPRRVRGVLSRFSFSVGADQDRPFKIAVEYGVRF